MEGVRRQGIQPDSEGAHWWPVVIAYIVPRQNTPGPCCGQIQIQYKGGHKSIANLFQPPQVGVSVGALPAFCPPPPLFYLSRAFCDREKKNGPPRLLSMLQYPLAHLQVQIKKDPDVLAEEVISIFHIADADQPHWGACMFLKPWSSPLPREGRSDRHVAGSKIPRHASFRHIKLFCEAGPPQVCSGDGSSSDVRSEARVFPQAPCAVSNNLHMPCRISLSPNPQNPH